MNKLEQLIETVVAEQATGCQGAGDYGAFAREHGYKFVEIVDWTSSAGDWTMIVSKNEIEWFVMWQENNWPRPGFTRAIEDSDEDQMYCGSAAEVLDLIYSQWV